MNLEYVLTDLGVGKADIEKAKAYRSRVGGSLEKILVNMGSVSEDLLPTSHHTI